MDNNNNNNILVGSSAHLGGFQGGPTNMEDHTYE